MKVVFVHPHGSKWMDSSNNISTILNLITPLGLLIIAAYLKWHGIDVDSVKITEGKDERL